MAQTRKAVGAKGTTATQWRIHPPICAASRSELLSGRYFHNIKSNYTTPGAQVSSGAIHHVDLENKVCLLSPLSPLLHTTPRLGLAICIPQNTARGEGLPNCALRQVHERQLWRQPIVRSADNIKPA
jgi:hypothetical protein